MRRMALLLTVASALVAMLALAGPALAQTADGSGMVTGMGTPPVTVLNAELTGEQEVPGPGDPDGSGTATVIVIPPDTICYVVTAQGIEPATAAHIHEAPPGEAGPVVQPLAPPTSGVSAGCTQADPALVSDLQENPEDYYVNVHNEEYPAGAIRGQLSE